MNASVPIAGIALAGGAAVAFEVGYVLQAREAREVDSSHALRASLFGRLAGRRLFVAGVGLSVAGFALQVAALGKAPLTVVQPILALGLVLLLVLGSRMLGERVGRRQVLGVVAIVAGVCAVVAAAPERSGSVDPGPMAIALAALAAATVFPFVLRGRVRIPGLALAVSAGAADAFAALAAKLLSDAVAAGRPGEAVAWAVAAGLAVLVGFNAELSALQEIAATRFAPIVLVMQVTIPVALAPVLTGEDWGSTALGGWALAAALAAVGAGTVLLGSSRAVGDLFAGEGENGPSG